MIRLAFRLCLAIFVAMNVVALPVAYAQDWSAGDGSIEARRAERYQQLVDQSPEESYAFNQLMQSTGRGSGYEKLLRTYEDKVAGKPTDFNLRMVLGHMYRYGGKLDKAMASYREAERIRSNALVALYIAKVEAESKNFVEATAAYERALSMTTNKSQKTEILRAIAEMAIARRDLPRARDAFAQLIALDDSVFLRRELAQIYEQNMLFDEAAETLADARKCRGITNDEKYRLDLDIASLRELQGRNNEALGIYDALESQLPESHWMRREIASRKIDLARKTGNMESLIQTLEKQWKKPTVEQHLELAQIYDEMGRTSDAESHYKKAISARSDNAESYEKYISFLHSHGRTSDANKVHTDRLKIKSLAGVFDYHYELYEAYVQQKRIDDAIKTLDNAAVVFKPDFDVLQRIADAYLMHGRTSKALDIYTAQVRTHPGDINAIEALGDYYDMQGQKALALSTWKKIESANVDRTTKLETLARIYDEHGYAGESLSMYSRIAAENKTDCQILKNYAEVLAKNGRVADAVTAYENLRDTCRTDATTQLAARSAARLISSRGNAQKAIANAAADARNNPNDETRVKYAALLALALDMPEKAIPALEAISSARPDDVGTKQTLASLYDAANMNEKARATLAEITDASSSNSSRRTALLALSEFDERHGDFETARANLARALDIDANDADSNERMGDILTKLRRYSEAANYYQEASLIAPQNGSFAYKYASALSMIAKDEEADAIYLRLVSTSNDETIIRRSADRAIDYHAWKNDLESLENAWKPLLYAAQRRELYTSLLLRVASLQAEPHIQAVQSKTSRETAASRHALRELARRHSRTITQALVSGDTALNAQGLDVALWCADAAVIDSLAARIPADSANALDRENQLIAVRAMAHAQLPSAVRTLAAIYSDASYPRALREHAIWALGLIPSPDAAKALTEALNAPIDSFRMLAILGLARQGSFTDRIVELARTDPGRNVQNTAAWAVAFAAPQKLRDIAASLQPSWKSEQFAATVAQAARNAGYHPYQLWTLSQAGDETAAQRLIEMMWATRGELRTAAQNLVFFGNSISSLQTLTPYEASGRIFVQNPGFYASSVDVESMLDDIVSATTAGARDDAWILGHTSALAGAIRHTLLGGADETSNDARVRMLDDLSASGALIASALDDDACRSAVRDAVAAFAPQLSAWISSCRSADCPASDRERAAVAMRAAMRYGLGSLDDTFAISQQSENRSLQFDAIAALALSDNPQARSHLVELADHADWLIRATAVEFLNANAPGERAALETATADTYAAVRNTARRKLEQH